MATVTQWNPFGVSLNITATAGTVTRTSATKYTVAINASWETYWSSNRTLYGMSATSGGVTKVISKYDGTKRQKGSATFTGTYDISGNGSATKTITVMFKNYNEDNDDSASKNVTFNVTVPAWTSYTVSYNANGGTGAPGKQTKWKDQALTLSSTKPTWTGHTFKGWALTKADADAGTWYYQPGGSCGKNENLTLYAVWQTDTYTVSYNANGGTGAPAAQTKTYGVTLKLSSTKPTKQNYNFLGWATSAAATSATYSAAGNYTANAKVTLYAVWELAYVAPRITGVQLTRCEDTNFTPDEEGTVMLYEFNWATDKPVMSMTIQWKLPTENAWSDPVTIDHTLPESNTDTGGYIGAHIYPDQHIFSPDTTYMVQITVADANGSSTVSATLYSAAYAMDFLAGGKGAAFGKAAEVEGFVDSNWDLHMDVNKSIFGTHTYDDGSYIYKEAFNPVNDNGNTVLGYGNFDTKTGNTNVYGYDVHLGVSNIADPGTFRPYRRQGDTLTITLRTAGYVSGEGKNLYFWIPMAVPVIGAPKVTAASGNGFMLRQGSLYTHGSGASTYTKPTSYEVTATMWNGLWVKAVFPNATNVTNNDSIGIYWHGTITFS